MDEREARLGGIFQNLVERLEGFAHGKRAVAEPQHILMSKMRIGNKIYHDLHTPFVALTRSYHRFESYTSMEKIGTNAPVFLNSLTG